jgi:hypothetical protein
LVQADAPVDVEVQAPIVVEPAAAEAEAAPVVIDENVQSAEEVAPKVEETEEQNKVPKPLA